MRSGIFCAAPMGLRMDIYDRVLQTYRLYEANEETTVSGPGILRSSGRLVSILDGSIPPGIEDMKVNIREMLPFIRKIGAFIRVMAAFIREIAPFVREMKAFIREMGTVISEMKAFIRGILAFITAIFPSLQVIMIFICSLPSGEALLRRRATMSLSAAPPTSGDGRRSRGKI